MRDRKIQLAALLTAAIFAVLFVVELPRPAEAGPIHSGYAVLDPIQHGNLTIFPVVANSTHDTSDFLTLDEGLRSGEVVVTEEGRAGLVRRHGHHGYSEGGGAQVNQLSLENNSKRPLLLLAGEIVTGGRQDRIVGKDLIIPAGEASDLSVFCVEPGRWTEKTAQFESAAKSMAQPSIRIEAMGNRDQTKVWEKVRQSQSAMENTVSRAAGAPAADAIAGTTSYAQVMDNKEVQQQVDKVAAPIEHDYGSLIHTLRSQRAVGVVVAVNGQIIWADLFASPQLLEKYWPKLVRSYATESVVDTQSSGSVSKADAQRFLEQQFGTHEDSDTDPGVYRYSEVRGDGYKVFRLTALLPDTGFDVHVAKMAL